MRAGFDFEACFDCSFFALKERQPYHGNFFVLHLIGHSFSSTFKYCARLVALPVGIDRTLAIMVGLVPVFLFLVDWIINHAWCHEHVFGMKRNEAIWQELWNAGL